MTPLLSLDEQLVVIALCMGGVGLVLVLLSRQRLTFPFATFWLFSFFFAAVGTGLLPLLQRASALLAPFRRDLYDVLFVAGAAMLVGFLLFLSVRVSVLTRRLEDLAQKTGLIEHSLDEKIQGDRKRSRQAATQESTDRQRRPMPE